MLALDRNSVRHPIKLNRDLHCPCCE
jgi:hypothetical protein